MTFGLFALIRSVSYDPEWSHYLFPALTVQTKSLNRRRRVFPGTEGLIKEQVDLFFCLTLNTATSSETLIFAELDEGGGGTNSTRS